MKVAVCFTRPPVDPASVCRRMAGAQSLFGHQQQEIVSFDHRGAAGLVSTAENFSAIPLRYQGPQSSLFISGVPVDMQGSLSERLKNVMRGDYLNAFTLLSGLDGAFAAVFWDAANKKLIITSDILGYQPLYIYHNDKYLLLATELKGIAASGLFPVEMNPGEWGAFLSFGHPIGEETSLKGVSCIRGGSVYTYDAETHEMSCKPYWKWPKPKPGLATLDDCDTASVIKILERNIAKYTEHRSAGTVLLSGGFDSRMIGALLADREERPQALIVDHPDEYDNADGKFAIRVAKRLGITYQTVSPDETFYSSPEYFEYAVMNEADTRSAYLFIANVSKFVRPQLQCVWEGLQLGMSLWPATNIADNFDEYLKAKARLRDSAHWKPALRIFQPEFVDEMFDTFTEILRREIAKYTDDEFGVEEFAFRNRARRRTGPNPYKVYANCVLPFTPGLCREYYEHVLAIPPSLKRGARLTLEMHRRHFKQVADIPVCSAGQLFDIQGQDRSLSWLKTSDEISRNPYVKAVSRRLGMTRFQWERSRLIDAVVEVFDAGHACFNRKGIEDVKKDPRLVHERELLFYLQVWRWIMEGKVAESREKLFSRGKGPDG